MKEPIEPKSEDCCNSGCNPCIFEVYEKQLMLYKSYIECGETPNTDKENAMTQLQYTTFRLIKNIQLCKQHKLLLFKQDSSGNDQHVLWAPGEHFLLKYIGAKQSCSRAYTPIKIEISPDVDYDFAIIVKIYVGGQVSHYLYNLGVGEQTLWRGPYGHYEVNSNLYSQIVMIAQGTGIAPLFSVIKHILNDEENLTKIILLYCCKCIDTILLREELYMFKSYWNFVYKIHLSTTSETMSFKYQEPISTSRLTSSYVLNLGPFSEKDQFLICGSTDFMNYYRKCLQDNNIQNIVTF